MCSNPVLFRFVHREIAVLGILVAAAIGTFLATRTIATVHHDYRRRDAAAWFRSGSALLDAGKAADAVEALQRAATIDRENSAYRLTLAGALLAAGQLDAARRVLLALRARAPENVEVNLRLARLEASRDRSAAVRYYHNALYGIWPASDADARRRVRLELIEYLLASGDRRQALSELLALEGTQQDNTVAHLETGRLFARAGDHRRALAHFEDVLREQPRDRGALEGAGRAAFQLGDYSRAARFLRGVEPMSPDARALREVSLLVLARDPLARRLPAGERRRRLQANVADAAARLDSCPGDSVPEQALAASLRTELEKLSAALRRRQFPRDLDDIESGVELIHRIERETAAWCPIARAEDRALTLIGQRHQGEAQ
jgi:tetratricopeptide (TPR) repeat protein